MKNSFYISIEFKKFLMEKTALRYLPTALLLIALLGSLYFVYSFISAGFFSFQTISLIVAGSVLVLAAMIVSIPSMESWFADKILENTILYWGVILVILITSIVLLQQGVASGGAEYANYMAQNA